MGKIRSKIVRWQPYETPNVRYRLYWASCRPVAHNLDYADVGTVTTVTLPDDIPSFPLVSGKFVLGVCAIGPSGNESDITTITADIDFTTPGTPRNLRIEDTQQRG
jgi:hypothetical protein